MYGVENLNVPLRDANAQAQRLALSMSSYTTTGHHDIGQNRVYAHWYESQNGRSGSVMATDAYKKRKRKTGNDTCVELPQTEILLSDTATRTSDGKFFQRAR